MSETDRCKHCIEDSSNKLKTGLRFELSVRVLISNYSLVVLCRI